MDLLFSALREALDRNAEERARWSKYKDQQLEAKKNLQEFQKSLEIDIMVPIGTKALIPGRLYHTNEIVVSHSGTYYSKCSVHKALEICRNRLNIAASRLEAIESEADLYRKRLELPTEYDAFSSNTNDEIIEPYDEEQEKQWRIDHKKKLKEHKRREAEERKQLLNPQREGDIINKLDELELLEELENDLEAISEAENENALAILNQNATISSKKSTSDYPEKPIDNVTSLTENCEVHKIDNQYKEEDYDDNDEDGGDNDTDTDDDDIPVEFIEIQREAKTMLKREKLNFFKAKYSELQEYLKTFKPKNMADVSFKTDQIFLSDYLFNYIEKIEDELNCDQFLNGENVIKEPNVSGDVPLIVQSNIPSPAKPILKKSTDKTVLPHRKISFALEDEVKSFDGGDEPSKISSTILFANGPVLNLHINHSEAKFIEMSENTNVIRSPVDIYKHFAEFTLSNEERKRFVERQKYSDISSNGLPLWRLNKVTNAPDIKEARTEVRQILDNIFGDKTEPDPLPSENFIDVHQPKPRVSLFKQSRLKKSK